MKHYFALSTLSAALLVLSGCGSDNEPFVATKDSTLTNQENVRTWVNGGSALAVYANVYQLIGVADGHDHFTDSACPVVADDGTTLTATGDCSESGGTQWVGSATVERSADGTRTLTLNDFGTRSDATHADTKEGVAHVRPVDATRQDFDVSLTRSSGIVTTFDYTGQVDGDYDAPTIWNGSGTMKRDGLILPNGTVDVSTTDEVVNNDLCSGQPLSGNTTVHNMADETVVVTYDGALDCDDMQAASFSLNGDPQGKITGISCMISPRKRGGEGTFSLLLVALFGLALRRRAPR